jgi:hypothetical protein
LQGSKGEISTCIYFSPVLFSLYSYSFWVFGYIMQFIYCVDIFFSRVKTGRDLLEVMYLSKATLFVQVVRIVLSYALGDVKGHNVHSRDKEEKISSLCVTKCQQVLIKVNELIFSSRRFCRSLFFAESAGKRGLRIAN